MFFKVYNRKAETLIPLITANVPAGAEIHSDKWRSYNGLTVLGYNHKTVNHTDHFVDPETNAHI